MGNAEGTLQFIESCCERGRYLDAFRAGEALGPFERWPGEEGLALGSIVATHLGAVKRSDRLDLLLYRRSPRSPRAFRRYVQLVLERRGPLAAHRQIEAYVGRGGGEDERASLSSARAAVATAMRDFSAAERALGEAERVDPHRPWLCHAWADLLEAQDRYDEALSRLEEALSRHPGDPGIAWRVGNMLKLLGRDEEALASLDRTTESMQSFYPRFRHAALLVEMGRHPQAWAVLERLDAVTPLAEPEVREAIAASRSDVAYALGDRARAIGEARLAKSPFFDRVVQRLEARPEGRRAQLPVPFVRQHHKTCAPATLTAISRFWGRAAEHLEIAEAICYDGTPNHSERRWAEEHGWFVREFSVTWASTVALIERGVPFTLTTTEAHGAHLQAVVGFDEARGTLLIRDPTLPLRLEADAEALFERYRSMGPRGMALVPADRRELLEGLELPDEALQDHLHQLHLALAEHRRQAASEHLSALEGLAPEHPLAVRAQMAVAAYDRDLVAMQAAAERTLRCFPEDTSSELVVLQCMRELAPRHERIERLEALKKKGGVHPLLVEELAAELIADARQHEQAGRLLRAAASVLRERGRPLSLLAELSASAGRVAEAAQLARFASCLDEMREEPATRSLQLARLAGQTEAGLDLLRQRRARLGGRSPASTVTYCWGLWISGRPGEATVELEKALLEHPDNGSLLLSAARWLAGVGQPERARSLLERAEKLTPRADWLEVSAHLSLREGQPRRALEQWKELLELSPLSEEAITSYADLLSALEGPAEARALLDGLARRFPRHRRIASLRIAALRSGAPEDFEAALRQHAAVHPSDAWAKRELASHLASQGRGEEALRELDEAASLDRRSADFHATAAAVLAATGDARGALAEVVEAIGQRPDDSRPFATLLDLLGDLPEPERALESLIEPIARASLDGLGALCFCNLARMLSPELLDRGTRALLEARPDLSVAWGGRAEVLLGQGKLDEADRLLAEATSRFPFAPRLLCTRADLAAARGSPEEEREHLEKACSLAPELHSAAERLSALHASSGRLDEARASLERALTGDPGHEGLTLALARLEARSGDVASALEKIARLLHRNPSSQLAWQAHAELSSAEATTALAEAVAVEHPRSADARVAMGQCALMRGDVDAALSALDEALALSPRSVDACELRMVALERAGRLEEALAVGAPERWGSRVPVTISGRLADLRASRGDAKGAIEQMRALLEKNRAYEWGWQRLLGWCRAEGDLAGAAQAAQRLVRLDPSSAELHAQLGDVLDDCGERAEARRALSTALHLDPSHEKAAHLLGALATIDGDFDEAERALSLLRKAAGPSAQREGLAALLLDAQIAAARGKPRRAREALLALGQRTDLPAWALLRARKQLIEADLGEQAQEALTEALGLPGDVHPQVPSLWVGTERARGRWSSSRLDGMESDTVRFRRVLGHELSSLAHQGRDEAVRAMVGRYRRAIDAHGPTWLEAASAMTEAAHPLRALRFLAGYRRRPDVGPRAAVHAAHALRALGLRGRASRVSQGACDLVDGDGALTHRLWLAYDHALGGRAEAALEQLEHLRGVTCSGFFEHLRKLTLGLVSFWQALPPERRRKLGELEGLLGGVEVRSPLFSRLARVVQGEASEAVLSGITLFEQLRWRAEHQLGTLAVWGLVAFLALPLLMEQDGPAVALYAAVVAAPLLTWSLRRKVLAAL